MSRELIKKVSDLLEEISNKQRKLDVAKEGLSQIIKHNNGVASKIAKLTIEELHK